MDDWKSINSANKDTEKWILGCDLFRENYKVMRWSTEYPFKQGCWMFAYTPTVHINLIQEFQPTHWMELPDLPKW